MGQTMALASFGLHDRVEFFGLMTERLGELAEEKYCLIAVDIGHFKVFNKWYGWEAGERFLNRIANELNLFEKRNHAIAGYFGGDNFALFVENDEELLGRMQKNLQDAAFSMGNMVGFLPVYGIYEVVDPSVSVYNMYDCALAALAHVTSKYEVRSCVYVPEMTEQIEAELRMIMEVKDALLAKQFTFYVQPKCCISNGKVVGAEALVRWIHPERGQIPPGEFIPVLEKNGFIGDLDRYVWEEVCSALHEWKKQGISPVPVSINVSRMDILTMDVVGYLKNLVDKYQVDKSLIKVEITESAYTENEGKIFHTIKELKKAGFTILMDDFGSGYSSLNMLKSAVVDVIKIDMQFLDMSEEETRKGIDILESVINMSSTMGIPVIVEGVETKKQEDYLVGMGCRYAQGYYYYSPMPVQEFAKLLGDERNLDHQGLRSSQVEQLHLREMMDAALFGDTQLNNILGPVVFYDMYKNDITITRVNDLYYRMSGAADNQDTSYTKKFWSHIHPDDKEKVLDLFDRACRSPLVGVKGEGRFIRADGSVLWIHLRLFLLREQAGHKLFFGVISEYQQMKSRHMKRDLSAEERKELDEIGITRIEETSENLPCGFGIVKVHTDEQENPNDFEVLYVNQEMRNICNSDVGRMRRVILDLFDDEVTVLMQKIKEAAYGGSTIKHFSYSSATCRYLQITLYQYRTGYVGVILRDVTKTYIYESILKSSMMTNHKVYFVHLEDDYFRMVYPDENSMLEQGSYTKTVARIMANGGIRQDAEHIAEFLSIEGIRANLQYRNQAELCYCREKLNGRMQWYVVRFNVCERSGGMVRTAAATLQKIPDISKWKHEQDGKNWWKY